MTTLVSDSFNRGPASSLGTADTGQVWLNNPTSPLIQINSSNQAQAIGNGGTTLVASVNAGASDYDVSITLSNVPSNGNAGLVIRNDGTSGQPCYFLRVNGGNYEFYIFGLPTISKLASQANGLSWPATVTLRLVAQGSTITAYANGTQLFGQTFTTAAGAATTNTYVGLRAIDATTTYDNFVVNSVGSSGPTIVTGTASMSGESSLTVTGQTVIVETASLTGECTLTVLGVITMQQTVTLGGESTLTASGITVQPESVSLAGESTLTVTGRVVASTAITLSGESTLSVNGQTVTVRSVALTGESTLSVNGQVVSTNKITTTGESSLTVRGLTVVVGSVSMSGESTLTVYTTVPLNELVTLQGEWIKNLTLEGEFVTTVILQGGVGMTKENQNFEVYAGESRNVSIPVSGADFSASTLTFTMKDPYGRLVTFTNPVAVTGDSSGNVKFKLMKEQTETLTTGNYRFKVEAEDQQNNDGVLTVGTIQVKSF